MTDPAALAGFVAVVPFAKHLDFTLLRCDATTAIVEVVLAPECCTAGGTAHGGFLMALADFTGAAAAYAALPPGARTTTTIESKTNMMAAAPAGTLLRATATPLHIGRRTSVWTTRIETPDGKLVSVTTQTQMML
ncbi:MAG: PaaI family thioesterase [Sandarakinorhabdus sp.]|nr:PaaI family thioesterase [Sandarakinorhabdus sp.]